jgi:NTE family protein
MALEEESSGIEQEMRPAIDCLRECPDLAGVDAATLKALAAGALHFSLPAGALLFDQEAPCEGVYLLVGGRLGVKSPGRTAWDAEVAGGELVGETDWLLQSPHRAAVMALRDCELLLLPNAVLDAARCSTDFSMAMARLAAGRLNRGAQAPRVAQRGRVFVIVANDEAIDVAGLATDLVAELEHIGATELVWEIRARAHTSAWFHRIEAANDFVVYVAGAGQSGWMRQCCRQADTILLVARARAAVRDWPECIAAGAGRGVRTDLVLLHEGSFLSGAATRWLESLPVACHHHIVDPADLGRIARLLTQRGVGLVLSGGGARGFAHLGIIRALREARVPIDFIGGVSIGAIIAAGVAMGWSDEEMRTRYHRCFVATNPVNDYTFPWRALTRGRKVARLLEQEYGPTLIEDLRQPFFCISANLANGRAVEHRDGGLVQALRASVAIPGVMPPICRAGDILVDGAAINNLPVDVMRRHAPGLIVGSDVGAERAQPTAERHLTIFKILMYSGLIHSAASAARQRTLSDVLFKPPLANVDLLSWQAFDRAIDAGYDYARHALDNLPELPRKRPVERPASVSSLAHELEQRLKRTAAAG